MLHLRLLIARSCSSIQQMEERLDSPKHKKVGQSLLCSTPGSSWLLHMTLVKEKLWMLYYYVFLLFLIVFKGEAYFWVQAQLLLSHFPSLTKFHPQTWEKQESHTQWSIEVIRYCELLLLASIFSLWVVRCEHNFLAKFRSEMLESVGEVALGLRALKSRVKMTPG